jgi:hypothetical protein
MVVLGGLAVLVTLLGKGKYNAKARDEMVLLLPAIAVLVLVSSQTGFNHSLRYVLPAFPYLFIWMSKVAKSFTLPGAKHRAVAALAIIALLWSVSSSLAVVPHSLSYFNATSGGPKNGYKLLGHSNTDWGQDLLYFHKWYVAHPEARPMHLSYACDLIDPNKMLDMDCKPVPIDPNAEHATSISNANELGPKPGWFAISVNSLQDGGRSIISPWIRPTKCGESTAYQNCKPMEH